MNKKILFTAALLAMFVTASQADAFWCKKSGGYGYSGYGYSPYYNSYPPPGYAYGSVQYAPETVVVQATPAATEVKTTRAAEIIPSGVVTSSYSSTPGTSYVVPSGYYQAGTTYVNPGTTYYYPSGNVYLGNGGYGANYGYSRGWNNGFYSTPGYYGGGWGSGFGIRFR